MTSRLSASAASTSASLFVALQVELGEWSAAAHRRVALAFTDEAQHDCPHERLALLRDPVVRALGQPRDRAVDAAGLAVGRQGEHVVLAFLPELEQGGGQQRQCARLALHVVDERVDELRLDLEPGAGRGQLDGAAQLRRLHRPDQHVVRAEQLGEARVGGEAAVEVCPQRDDDDRSPLRIGGCTSERVREGVALGVRAAGGEQLLELVDGEQQPFAGGSVSSASASGSVAPDTSARRSSSSGRSPGRISTRRQLPLPGRTPAARAGRRPARSSEDFPLPDGPTMPRNPAPTRRATSSATSRSRPKK